MSRKSLFWGEEVVLDYGKDISFDLCWIRSKRCFCKILGMENLILGWAIAATFYHRKRVDCV